jgi:hypothetical protein
MRHVDDGTLHAWLDGEVTDRALAAWVDEHLRDCADCAARLAAARATIAQAEALLARAAPDIHRLPFERLAERTGPPVAPGVRTRRWLMPASWAASVALAAVLGWVAREGASQYEQAPVPASAVAQAPVTTPETDPDGRVSDSAAPPATPQAGARSVDSSAAMERRISPPVANTATEPSEARSVSATPSAPALPESLSAERQANGSIPFSPGVSFPSDRQRRSALAAPMAPEAASARQAVSVTAPLPAAVGGTVSLTPSTAAPNWRVVSRTEAAVRTMMPLYGIPGLTPTFTAIDAARPAVRTMYQLPSGSLVELVQEPLGGATFRSPVAPPAPALGAADLAADSLADPRVWSGVRGNARLTLRALSDEPDVSALSSGLRLD